MYGFCSKLVRLSKPVRVTNSSKTTLDFSTKFVYFLYIASLQCFIVQAPGVFLPGKPFQSSIIFAGDSALQVVLLCSPYLGKLLTLLVKMLARDLYFTSQTVTVQYITLSPG